MSKIAHITSAHSRFDIRIFRKECKSLCNNGHEVHLIVADGEGDANVEGVAIHDVGIVRGRFQRMLILPWRILSFARRLDVELFHFHDPELLLIALPLLRTGAVVVYDSHEDVPRAILSREWINIRLRRFVSVIFERFENIIASRVSGVVGATDYIAERFSKFNLNSIAVNNYALDSEVNQALRFSNHSSAVCYFGGISRARGIFEMVKAMDLVDGKLILAGLFESPEVERTVRELTGWAKVDYRGLVDRTQLRQIMAESCAGLVFFHPEPNHVYAQPNKLFEYMSFGLPVLASNFPLWRSVLETNNVGLTADPLNPYEISEVINRAIVNTEETLNMGQRARNLTLSLFVWSREESKLVEFYDRLLSSPH